MASPYTPATRRAIAKYGEKSCIEAWRLSVHGGEGAHSISLAYYLPGINTTRQVDAAINAGAEIIKAAGAKP